MSTFSGVLFDWEFGNPKRTRQDGALHLSGSIIIYSQDDLDALFGLVRPVAVRVAGDPSPGAGGLVYVDHWGPDPSGPLAMTYLAAGADNPTPVTYTAILTNLGRNEALPRGVHKADADFLLLIDEISSIPGQTGSPRTGQTAEQSGAPSPDTGLLPPGDVPGSGGAVGYYLMGSRTDHTGAMSLWNGTDNDSPPAGWEQPDYDATDWDGAQQAAGAENILPTTQAVWWHDLPVAYGEEVLFHQTFGVPDGTILMAIMRMSFPSTAHLSAVWVNGVELDGSTGMSSSGTLAFEPSILLPGEQNTFATSVINEEGDTAWVSFLMEIQRAVVPETPPAEPPP